MPESSGLALGRESAGAAGGASGTGGAGAGLGYIPALDGIRAFAVLSVMAYHGGVVLSGGFLGVDTFFVLSGFLITTLLVEEWRRRRFIHLAAFWARRARRLLPALLLMLLFVAAYAAFIVPAGSYPDLRLDSLSTLFYVANWHFVLIGSDYFNQTGVVSPLTHTWSLAIEEQFYVVWPLVVLGVLQVTKRLSFLFGVCVTGALASAIEMGVLYQRGADTTRLYYGTDTHAQSLLVGAALAVGLAMAAERRRAAGRAPVAASLGRPLPGGDLAWVATSEGSRTLLLAAGAAGVAGTGLLWSVVNGQTGFLFEGGFMLAALLTAAVLASVACAQRGPVAQLLSWAPLRYLGRISYGMYLWHFPLFLWIDHARTGLFGLSLFAIRALVTVAVATLSYYLVERPIRQGTFFREWRAWVATPLAVAVVIVALVGATVAPAEALGKVSGPTTNRALYSGPPVRILMLGDSTALTLGIGLLGFKSIDTAYDIKGLDEALLGCGVAEGEEVELLGVIYRVNAACQPQQPASVQWPADWQGWVDSLHPNVVAFLAGRWEVANRTFNGKWTNILQPAFAAYVKGQLQKAVDIATSRGARIVLFTAPCYDSGEQPDGEPWPEDMPARVEEYNRLLRQVVAANPGRASVFDLYRLVCPDGQFEASMAGVPLRTSDGVHFTVPGGEWLAASILPDLVELGRVQMARQP